jgi:DNA-binding MarR family transcriptional regulator
VKPSWEAVLREIGRHQTTTIRRVATATGDTPAATRNVVLALIRRGYVERVTWSYDPESGFRRYAIGLTEAGRRALRRRSLAAAA